MTEKVDIYRMGLVFQKHLIREGLRVPATRENFDGASDAHTAWHKSYKEVSCIHASLGGEGWTHLLLNHPLHLIDLRHATLWRLRKVARYEKASAFSCY